MLAVSMHILLLALGSMFVIYLDKLFALWGFALF